MQMTGGADLVGALNSGGAVMALWEFLKNLPFGLGVIVVPINILVILASFITCADATHKHRLDVRKGRSLSEQNPRQR